mgnify:CR=1 FL=1
MGLHDRLKTSNGGGTAATAESLLAGGSALEAPHSSKVPSTTVPDSDEQLQCPGFNPNLSRFTITGKAKGAKVTDSVSKKTTGVVVGDQVKFQILNQPNQYMIATVFAINPQTNGHSIVGVVSGDEVALDGATAAFADKHAGLNKTVTIDG